MSLAEIDAVPAWDPAEPASPPARPGRVPPGGDGRAAGARVRSRLVVLPGAGAAPDTRRLPFVLTLVVLLAVSLAGLLLLNTVMAQDSVRATRLAGQSARLDAQRQALAEQLDRLQSPASLAAAAAAAGLTPQTDPPILDLGTGKIISTR